jgi:hypothetical protein
MDRITLSMFAGRADFRRAEEVPVFLRREAGRGFRAAVAAVFLRATGLRRDLGEIGTTVFPSSLSMFTSGSMTM